MATIDRIEPVRPAWGAPSSSTAGFTSTDEATEEYVGRHRKPGARGLNVLRLFYVGRHRRN
jgi:hypothetical protein